LTARRGRLSYPNRNLSRCVNPAGHPHHTMTQLFGRTPGLTGLDARARDIFRGIVESYLETGEPGRVAHPVAGAGCPVAGLDPQHHAGPDAAGPAGRAPHQRRADADPRGPAPVRRRLAGGRRHRRGGAAPSNRAWRAAAAVRGGAGEASSILCRAWPAAPASWSRPVREAGVKHVEFVALGGDQALAVLVFDDGSVENRLMPLPGVTPSALQEASNFLNARLRGRTLHEAKDEMRTELDAARRELDETAAASGRGRPGRLGRRRGRRAGADRARPRQPAGRRPGPRGPGAVRMLFDDLEQKEQLIGLLDGVRDARACASSSAPKRGCFAFGFRSVIAAPYMTGRQRCWARSA
jgi:heat-inducible transcriptional repressor